jgi:hypothetical protein
VGSIVAEERPSKLHVTHAVDELTPYLTLVRMTYSSYEAIGADLQEDYSFDVRVGASVTIAAPDAPPCSARRTIWLNVASSYA